MIRNKTKVNKMNYYAYDEPITGLTETGKEYTACQTIVMSEQDAINSWRSMYCSNLGKVSDEAILCEFIVCNYAYKISPITKLEDE